MAKLATRAHTLRRWRRDVVLAEAAASMRKLLFSAWMTGHG
jgi:hypothetical protein